jgi:hypothetical protein
MNFRFLPSAAVLVATTLAAVCAAAANFAATAPGLTQNLSASPLSPSRAGSPGAGDAQGGWREAKKETKAEEAKKADAKKAAAEKADAKKAATKLGEPKSAKPVQVGSFADWGAFLAEGGKEKTCYALATPKAREPAKLQRDPAYIFISNRPAEKVRNEVSVIMGFAMKDGAAAHADVGGENFDLVAKGSNAWIKNPAEETRFVEALKKGSKLIVKASSIKGNVTTDAYSLAGISDALERVQKDCP